MRKLKEVADIAWRVGLVVLLGLLCLLVVLRLQGVHVTP